MKSLALFIGILTLMTISEKAEASIITTCARYTNLCTEYNTRTHESVTYQTDEYGDQYVVGYCVVGGCYRAY